MNITLVTVLVFVECLPIHFIHLSPYVSKDMPLARHKQVFFLKCLKLLWDKFQEVGFLWRRFASWRGRGEGGGLTHRELVQRDSLRIENMDT